MKKKIMIIPLVLLLLMILMQKNKKLGMGKIVENEEIAVSILDFERREDLDEYVKGNSAYSADIIVYNKTDSVRYLHANDKFQLYDNIMISHSKCSIPVNTQ